MNPDSRDLIAQGKVDHREVESEGSRRQTKSEAVSKVTDTASLDWYLAFVLFCLILGIVVCTVLLLEKLHVNLAKPVSGISSTKTTPHGCARSSMFTLQ